MTIEYRQWPPPGSLEGVVLAYWAVAGSGSSVPSPAILPDAYIELVLDLADPVTLLDSVERLQPQRAIVGLLERAIPMRYGERVGTFGVRFHAARAAGFFGVAAATLVDRVTPLPNACPSLDALLSAVARRGANPLDDSLRSDIDHILQRWLARARVADPVAVRAVDHLLGVQDPVTVASLARVLGISPRQLRRRFVNAVGVTPKRLERLARFGRTWQQATMGPPVTWADLALSNGYADQAHLVREFRAFGAEPPGHLFTAEWYDTTAVVPLRPNGGD